MVAEFLPTISSNLPMYSINLCLDVVVDFLAVFIVLGACLGGDGEALRNRHAEIGHLSQVCTFAAEELSHFSVALGKRYTYFCSLVIYLQIFAKPRRSSPARLFAGKTKEKCCMPCFS